MLSFDQVDDLLQPLSDYFERFNQSVIEDMARRLTQLFEGQKRGLSSTLWQLDRLRESGALYDDILSRLGELTPYTEQELKRIFEQAGLKSIEHEHAIIKDLGRSVVSLEQSPEMINVLRASLIKTKGVLYNLTQTMPMAGQDQFIEVSDLAYEQVARGTLSIDEAVRQGVTGLAEQGINVINYSKGRVEKADVALLRNVRTGIVQTTGDMTLAMAGELGVDTVEVSAHAGARNKGTGPMNHAGWQGKVYSISGRHEKYPPLIETTGYGTATGLSGINCRHSMYLYFEEVSTPEYTQAELNRINNTKVTCDGQQMDLYEATQKQRYIERQIRMWKRKTGALDAAGLDNTEERLKVGQWQAKARDFTKQTGLVRRYEWEQVPGANVRGLTKPRENLPPRKTVGISFLSGDTQLTTTSQAKELGESANGWKKYEQIFKQEYLTQFKLVDDVERTIGFWGGPEPSFNAHLLGQRENVIAMSKAWGKNFNQQAVALLFPSKNGAGGKLMWNFGRELTDSEWDTFFASLIKMNSELGEQLKEYVGVTVKGLQKIEYWYSNEQQRRNAYDILKSALENINLPAKFSTRRGFDFILLEQGNDY